MNKISDEVLELLGALFLLIISILVNSLMWYVIVLLLLWAFNIDYHFMFYQAIIISFVHVALKYDLCKSFKDDLCDVLKACEVLKDGRKK